MRLGETEREGLLQTLGEHHAAGHLDAAELERRVEVVVEAQTYEQARAAFADLPPLPGGPPAGRRRRRWGRGHAEAQVPGPGWQPTEERFRDPRSGQVLRVWIDSGGGRRYVPDSAP